MLCWGSSSSSPPPFASIISTTGSISPWIRGGTRISCEKPLKTEFPSCRFSGRGRRDVSSPRAGFLLFPVYFRQDFWLDRPGGPGLSGFSFRGAFRSAFFLFSALVFPKIDFASCGGFFCLQFCGYPVFPLCLESKCRSLLDSFLLFRDSEIDG